nr:hypothetical protein CFP56_41863 [Quercus suber]
MAMAVDLSGPGLPSEEVDGSKSLLYALAGIPLEPFEELPSPSFEQIVANSFVSKSSILISLYTSQSHPNTKLSLTASAPISCNLKSRNQTRHWKTARGLSRSYVVEREKSPNFLNL